MNCGIAAVGAGYKETQRQGRTVEGDTNTVAIDTRAKIFPIKNGRQLA